MTNELFIRLSALFCCPVASAVVCIFLLSFKLCSVVFNRSVIVVVEGAQPTIHGDELLPKAFFKVAHF